MFLAPRSLEYDDVMGTLFCSVTSFRRERSEGIVLKLLLFHIYLVPRLFISWICLLVNFVFASLGLFGLSCI